MLWSRAKLLGAVGVFSLFILSACANDSVTRIEREIMVPTNLEAPVTFALTHPSDMTTVFGQVTIDRRSNHLLVEVSNEPGYRLVIIEACAEPNFRRNGACSPWIRPTVSGHQRNVSFAFNIDELRPSICTPDLRVFLHFCVEQTE
ncbi:MAG: hypothetical protein V1738_02475 [Patescibacteria group bacterium]